MSVLQGMVIKSTGSHYKVYDADRNIYDACLSGKIRLENRKSTNPVCVGDRVDLENTGSGWVITRIHPRKNYLIRQSNNLSKITHILASNLDQALLLVTFSVPFTPQGFIDRFLITCEAYRIPVLIVVNKCDLHDDVVEENCEFILEIYRKAGYPCLKISCQNKTGIAELKERLKDKITLLGGNSGTGKSSLIRELIPGINIKVADISYKHLKGKHTTTFAEMYPLPEGGFIIDTPGIKDLGLVEMKPEEVGHYFPEIRKYMHECRFNNCTHDHEPGCAILKYVTEGKISEARYRSYWNIIHGEEMDWEPWKLK